MDLNPNKGVWDNISGKVIAPMYQAIIFDNDVTTPFSFSVALSSIITIQQPFNAKWSKKINSEKYKESENYRVFIKFYYQVKNSTIVEKCIGKNITTSYKQFDTKYWSCFNSTSSDPELININKLCDGISNCADSSDETVTLCQPKYSYFETVALICMSTFVFLGIIAFLIVQKVCYIVNIIESSNATEHITVTKEILYICVKSTDENYRKNTGIDHIDVQKMGLSRRYQI